MAQIKATTKQKTGFRTDLEGKTQKLNFKE